MRVETPAPNATTEEAWARFKLKRLHCLFNGTVPSMSACSCLCHILCPWATRVSCRIDAPALGCWHGILCLFLIIIGSLVHGLALAGDKWDQWAYKRRGHRLEHRGESKSQNTWQDLQKYNTVKYMARNLAISLTKSAFNRFSTVGRVLQKHWRTAVIFAADGT